MASNMTRVPVIRAISRRALSQAAPKVDGCDINVSVTESDNKIKIASYDNCAPVTSISVAVRAGSRYECPDTYGASHLLRSCAGLATSSFSKFAITRFIEETGGSLFAVSDRDTITYTLRCLRDQLPRVLPVLGSVVSEQCFKPWEVNDNKPRLEIELAQVTEQARVMDMLHTAAYRTSLGNSLFIPKFRLKNLNSETLQFYYQNTFSTQRTAIGAVSASASDLQQLSRALCLGPACGEESPAKYYGGEIRKPSAGCTAYVALAVEGSGLNKLKDALALTVLKHALGTGPHVPYGINAGSPLAKGVLEASGTCPNSAVTAFNICHTDSGLFGVNLAVDASVAKGAVENVVKVLRAGSVSNEAVARGKAAAKIALLTGGEQSIDLAEDLAQQALAFGCVRTPIQLAKAVEELNASDISSAAKKVSGGKLSLVAVGNIKCVPYLADLN